MNRKSGGMFALSAAVLFTSTTRVFGDEVQWVEKVIKYLGDTLDKRLTFTLRKVKVLQELINNKIKWEDREQNKGKYNFNKTQ